MSPKSGETPNPNYNNGIEQWEYHVTSHLFFLRTKIVNNEARRHKAGNLKKKS